MIQIPMDILHQFPVRRTKKQKEDFRNAVQKYGESLGYECKMERKCLSCQNMLFGDPENAKYLVTAHYDTCAKMLVPNFITPCNAVLYVLYQLGLIFLLVICAAAVGVAAGLLFGPGAVKWASLAVYWLLLFLLILGPANKTNANDNTSGVVTLLEIMRTMPVNQRDKVCFVLFDQEEIGLVGSSFYRSRHRKASDSQLVLNLDCVGDGDHLMMFPTKKLKKDRKKLTSLYRACGYLGKKSLTVREKGVSIYPSDQMAFPYGVGICALKNSKFGLYIGKIHTSKDIVLEETNVNILRAALTSYICCDAAQ